ncbi:EAL domain-containing protein [Paenibacillus thiaminolyticus]|uniref:EAL domain-containing protein n=1 Tax=Paenibacillus thiaminolyticus TaxID=49283 RepID=A0A3A3GN92_PANTH|nr:EAL domain-containing protein [Paenibacillus thiaminolyticus]RJG24352.1 EAL domain-containing protein [Paenibacillus thiaminolyticus]
MRLKRTLEIYPVFQPIVDRRLSIIGYESFIRGADSRKALDMLLASSPEDMECINAIDLECKALALDNYSGHLPLFLNSHPFSTNALPKSLPYHNQHPLIIEITEHGAIQDEQLLIGHIERLSAAGIHFAIDDFGYGYMSIPFILRLKPQYIKLAKEVVHACEDNSVLQCIEKLMHSFQDMGIQIIAEGIETELQFQRMQRFADGFQGYWISEPKTSLL